MDFARRKFLGVSAAAAALAATGATVQPAKAATSGTLKGIGYADRIFPDPFDENVPPRDINGWARIQSLQPDWWYNWNQHRFDGTGSNFVPMLYSDNPDRLKTLDADLASCNMPTRVLGFNEPDHTGQAEMSVDEAIELWPTLEKAAAVEGLRIGAPVTASPDNAWFQDFMAKAKTRGLKIDYIPLHIYQNPSVNTFLGKVDNVRNKYGLPVWVTETAVADLKGVEAGNNTNKSTLYTRDQVNDYMAALWIEVNKRSWLERFAWKTRDANDNQMWFSALFHSDGRLTTTGELYASLT